MKNLMLLLVAVAIAGLAGAMHYHAETGRYQISPVAGLAGVYQIDTRSGAISICSPAYEQGCVTLEQAHQYITENRERVKGSVMGTAQQANDAVESFTKNRAQELRGVIQKLAPEKQDPAAEAPDAIQ